MAVAPADELDVFSDNSVLNAINRINELNDSYFRKGLECLTAKHLATTKAYEDGCDVDWDSVLCWPESPPGTLVKVPCFEELHGILYDSTREFTNKYYYHFPSSSFS